MAENSSLRGQPIMADTAVRTVSKSAWARAAAEDVAALKTEGDDAASRQALKEAAFRRGLMQAEAKGPGARGKDGRCARSESCCCSKEREASKGGAMQC